MMEAAIPIQPYGFDRVFRFVEPDEKAESKDRQATQQQVADLEARIERMREEHKAELARARSDGFDTGLAQARREREEAMLASSDALNAALEDVRREFNGVSEQIAQDAAVVAYEAARILAGHASAIEPGKAVDEALTRVLDQVSKGMTLVLKVHPDMREDMETRLSQRDPHEQDGLKISVVADERIVQGDARIDWSGGGLAVDASARHAAVLSELEGLLSKDVEV